MLEEIKKEAANAAKTEEVISEKNPVQFNEQETREPNRRLVLSKSSEPTSEIPQRKTEIRVTATIFPKEPIDIPIEFFETLNSLEKSLGLPIWLLAQRDNGIDSLDYMSDELVSVLMENKEHLLSGKRMAVVVDSPGGTAKCAFQLAKLFSKSSGGFLAIVPRYAKSAATLLSLGADKIMLGKDAELGPLDAQLYDPEREDSLSALDEVQALERLHAFALEAVDRSMILMLSRCGKKMDTLLPLALKFVSDMMRPLLEKIDAIHYTQMSRALKVAEEYAIRLLRPRFPRNKAEEIARKLVEDYPEHGFVIDYEECKDIGLHIVEPDSAQTDMLNKLYKYLGKVTLIGQIKQAGENEKD
ncbi:MAG: hypothetical protein L0Y74_04770 [candidate division Zixibacteria bacterium]|nr:hypothetical protein [candidate division Zixibacteria bacterium]